jgi:hypothetical protein
LGERLLCKQEVVGSIPSGSTRLRAATSLPAAPDRAAFEKARSLKNLIRALAIASPSARVV